VRSIFFALALAAVLASFPANVAAQPRRARAARISTRARVLDREGVKAFGEGRYNDAIRFFEEAHRLGGPPFELWNIAKCHILPRSAGAGGRRCSSATSPRPSLPADDRKEASEQLEELSQSRSSTLTVSSSPTGAVRDASTASSSRQGTYAPVDRPCLQGGIR
jgi:hypothetical protein